MNKNITCYQGLSFQIWVDYKNFWKKKKLFAECHEDDTRWKRLCRVPAKDTRQNIRFAECHLCSTRQRITAVRHPDGRRACWARDLSLPSARLLALDKGSVCRVLFFADGQHSVKCGHAVCHMFAAGLCRVPSAILGFPVVMDRRESVQ